MIRRRRMATAPTIILLLLALAACIEPPARIDIGGTPTQPANDNWYQLYFTEPEQTADLDRPTGGIPDKVIETLDAARTSIEVAVLEFDLQPMVAALTGAAARGVKVRVVTDSDSHDEPGIAALREAGLPIVEDGQDGLMHDKFIVIDGVAVWTGSMNFTRNDAYRNNNNFMYIQSTRLARNYTQEFEEMFFLDEFGPSSPADTPSPVVTLNGTRIENYFSPDDGVAAQIESELELARSSIYFMAYAFTRRDFAQTLLDQAAAGLDVRGVFETRQIAAGADQAWLLLTQGGLADQVRQDGNRYNLHSKVFIIDKAVVVMGSYNFSNNAEQRNDENVLIIHNADIAQAYFAEWERVWAQAE